MSGAVVTYQFLQVPAGSQRSNATARVYGALREAIAGLAFQPGEFLDKQAIAQRMGVSRFPVGEALNRLAAEGLVDITPQIGSRASLIRLGDARENMFLRRALETEAIRALTKTVSAERAREMMRNLDHQQVAADAHDRANFHFYDVAFHAVMVDQLGFERVRQVMETARLGLDRVRRLLNTRRSLHITLAEHRAIAEAIANRNTTAAVNAMETHLAAVLAELETFARKALRSSPTLPAPEHRDERRTFTAPSGAKIGLTELGFGTAPIGNLFRPHTEREVQATLDAAWAAGIRYFDTAPFYGLGLSETRLNHFLRGKKRGDYAISTKVGRVLEVCAPDARAGIGKFFNTPSRRERFDYSHDGILRSLEHSLERLGIDQVEILYVHDIDVFTHGSEERRDAHVKTLLQSGYKALRRLRDERVVKAIGAGINEWQVAETLTRALDPDMFLLAGRYTLLEQEALNSFLPLCEARGIGIVIGGPYNSGILATGAKKGALYDYAPAPRAILERVAGIEACCAAHRVKLPQAALRFPLMHPAVVSVIPGAVSPGEVALNLKTMSAKIPRALWRDLKAQGLLHANAPVKA